MSLTRRLARPMLAAVFVHGGIAALRAPKEHAVVAESVAPTVAESTPLPRDSEQLVMINAAVQLGAGLLLAFDRVPRLAAAALAASLVPTTFAAHRFWEAEDPGERAGQQVHFLKNIGLLGGLVLATFDT